MYKKNCTDVNNTSLLELDLYGDQESVLDWDYESRRETGVAKNHRSFSEVCEISVQAGHEEILSGEVMNSPNQDMETESPFISTPPRLKLPLFNTGRPRIPLSIKVQRKIEDEYDRVKQGGGTQTKAIKNYCARLQKHLLFRSKHHHFTQTETADVDKFKTNNNLPGLKQLYGFVESEDKSAFADTGMNDNIRNEALQYCHNSASEVLRSGSEFAAKLTELKYLDKLELSVLHPNMVEKWKND